MFITLAIIAVTCLVSFLAFSNAALMQRLILWPPAITRRRQYERLVTYGLIHADGAHLLVNMFTLFFFGAMVERLFRAVAGGAGFVLFYVGALVVSALPSYFEHRDDANYRSLGASGAVSAALFSFILVQPWATIYVYVLPVPAILYAVFYVVYSVMMDRRRADNVNHSAHLWGAAYGVAATALLEPRLLGLFFQQLAHPSFSAR